jgi:hypothetical protein
MTERHPRTETQEERAEEYKELNMLIRRLVLRDGGGEYINNKSHSYGCLEMTYNSATYMTRDNEEIEVSITRFLTESGERHVIAEVAKLYDEHALGRQTTYGSIDMGSFLRNDIDGNELGIPQMIESAGTPLSKGILTLAGLQVVVEAKETDMAEGIDGLPITAQETRGLINALETATFKPQD